MCYLTGGGYVSLKKLVVTLLSSQVDENIGHQRALEATIATVAVNTRSHCNSDLE